MTTVTRTAIFPATTATGRYQFASALGPQLARYLEFKTAMGAYGSSRIWYLKQFDTYCLEHGVTVLDKNSVEGWVSERLAGSTSSYRSWMSYIRDFGRWMQTHEDPHAYVLTDAWKASYLPARPYLLTSAQIEEFFTAASALECASPWRWQAVAFFTLMHSCGLRTGEVRNLRPEHLNLHQQWIDVVVSKTGRARRLPITSEVAEILAACLDRSRHHGHVRGQVFFTNTGNQVGMASIGVVFNRIWDNAHLPRPDTGPRPRPYAFRHHFAYANIHRWMLTGRDVNAMLPYLSRYMGHASIESTYYYVHTAPDFMTDYADITTTAGSVLPEVGWS